MASWKLRIICKLGKLPNGVALTLCLATILGGTAPVAAQIDPAKQYREVAPAPWIENRTEFSRMRIDVPGILRGSKPFDANTLNRYFQQYIFAQMTLTSEADLNALPERRQDFLKLLQRQTTSKEAHDHVVSLALRTMEGIATTTEGATFHPAVRYNAMLILGEMNSEEAQLVGTPRTPPLPHSGALTVMLRELSNPAQLEAVRVAALVGILRHAHMESENAKLNRSRFDDAELRQLIDQMLALIKAAPPEGRSQEGHAWMQRRAIEVLAEIGKVDSGGSVASVLDKIVADEKASLALRCTAARAIGMLSFTTVANFNAVDLAMELGELAQQCIQQELARVDEYKAEEQRRQLLLALAQQDPTGARRPRGGAEGGRREGGAFGNQFGGQLGDDFGLLEQEADWRMLVSKRRLRYQLGCVRLALAGSELRGASNPQNGLFARATGDQKATVQQLVIALDQIIGAVEANSATQDGLLQRVAANMPALEAVLGTQRSSAPAGPGVEAAPAGPAGPAASVPTGPGVPGPGGELPGGPGLPAGPGAPAAPGAPAGPGELGPGAPGG